MPDVAELHRSVFQAVESRASERVPELYHPDARSATPDGAEGNALEVVTEMIQGFASAFPDLSIEIRHPRTE